jgi:hypothetical protein
MLDEKMQRVVETQRLGYVASVCPDGTPNLSPKGTCRSVGCEPSGVRPSPFARTVGNIEAGNTVVEINVVDPILRKGYRFKGPATVHRDGPIFDKALRFYFDRSGLDPNRVEAIVLVEMERAEPVTSPAYDDGSAEDDGGAAVVDAVRLAANDLVELEEAEPLVMRAAQDGDSSDIGDVERWHAHGSAELGARAAVASTSLAPK